MIASRRSSLPISNEARFINKGFPIIPSPFFEPILPLIDVQSQSETESENEEKVIVNKNFLNFLCDRSVISDSFLLIEE